MGQKPQKKIKKTAPLRRYFVPLFGVVEVRDISEVKDKIKEAKKPRKDREVGHGNS